MSRLGDFMDISLADYWDELNRTDFWFHMSDDPSVYRRGKDQMDKIERWAKCSEAHAGLLSDFWAYYGRETSNKPQRPQETA